MADEMRKKVHFSPIEWPHVFDQLWQLKKTHLKLDHRYIIQHSLVDPDTVVYWVHPPPP